MLFGRTNVNKFLVEAARKNPDLAGDFSMLISDVVRSCKTISHRVSRGALVGTPRDTTPADGELEQALNALANEAFIEHCEWGGHLAAIASEEMDDIYSVSPPHQRGDYLLLLDPLDGSTNLDVNLAVGSIFSILKCPRKRGKPTAKDFLQPGTKQLAAGYALYGPASMLVLTVGDGTHGFTLDHKIGEYLLTHPNMQVPADTNVFAINTSNERFWEPPVQRYVDECLAGKSGMRDKDFNMRWIASMVAEVHRILMRGGVFMSPRDNRKAQTQGKHRLLFEANPMALVMEQAGGVATTGRERILDADPTDIHQRAPVILGSRNEVERIVRYHGEYDTGTDQPYSSPLFNNRTLFRPA